MSDRWLCPDRSIASATAGEAFGILKTVSEDDDVAYAVLYTLDGVPKGAVIPGRWEGRETSRVGTDTAAVIRRLSAHETERYRRAVAEIERLPLETVRCWDPIR